MNRPSAFYRGLGCCGVVFSLSSHVQPAHANDRRFTYIEESAVLPYGARELEVWTTWRKGRETGYYSAFDQRIEFELGLGARLATAFYVNFTGLAFDDSAGQRQSDLEYRGVSSEWKYKVSDPVADPLGFGLYSEFTALPDEYEIEAKLLVDKQVGDLLLAVNAVGEVEFERGSEETEAELILEPVAGLSYQITPWFSAGVEGRERIVRAEEQTIAPLFFGPVLSVTQDEWWATLTFQPQLVDLETGHKNLVDQERRETRLLFSFHL